MFISFKKKKNKDSSHWSGYISKYKICHFWEFYKKVSLIMHFDKIKNYIVKSSRHYNRLLYGEVVNLKSEKKSEKNVLFSYLTYPFRKNLADRSFDTHSNPWECLQMAKIWVNCGFNVDIIDWDNNTFIPEKDYSIFIDIHSNMERLAPLMEKNCKKILHITGAYWLFQNDAENKRLLDLKARRGISLQPRRQVPPSNGIDYADCATILGNEFTQGTFSFSGKPLYPVPLSTAVQYPLIEKNFREINKSFLWFGSSGMVHKGLDLVIEAFSALPDYKLTVCGPVNLEPDFEKEYYHELYQSPNIRTTGFIDIKSDQFLNIIKNTCALIYPSCSEGQAGSVITCLHAGLIPVISYESGVDVEDFGIILKECSIDEIIRSIKQISQKPEHELHSMSEKAWCYARKHHTREKFAEDYEKFVNEI
jgi:glycosyltransferase involved in cell wall biosynthesis